MAPLKHPGPTCQTKDCYDNIEDGTLARTPSPLPAHVDSAAPQGTAKAARRVVAKGACSFLNPQSRDTVVAPAEAFERLRKRSGAAKISPPVQKAEQSWRDNSKSAAIVEEVQIDNQKIVVIRPTENEVKGKNLPTTKQVVEALRAVPAGQRAWTNEVIISPVKDPKSPDSAADAGDGSVTFFPIDKAQSQNNFDNRLMHESGHNYQGSLWKETGAGPWERAATADDRRPSPYAARNYGEDFCEFIVLYNTAKGTSCEVVAEQIYPNRWKKMEDYRSP
jgi:hypothetical protein